MTALTSGVGNVCVGLKSQPSATTGSTNVSVGNSSLFSLTTGVDNTAFGEKAGYDSGNASRCHVTGNQCCFIGTSARPASQNLTNATALGSNAIVDADNTIQLGNTAVVAVKTSGTITAAAPTAGSHLTTKTYVDDKFTTLSNQNLKTTDDVTFKSVACTNGFSTGSILSTGLVTASGLKLPNVGGSAGTLSHYEEYSFTTSFTGCANFPGVQVSLVRIGKLVTMHVQTYTNFQATTSGYFQSAAVIPAQFRPSFEQYQQIGIYRTVDGDEQSPGVMEMSSGGLIRIGTIQFFGFVSGTYGGFAPFSATWII